jgi:predicted RNA binding protein with dsRBD fold (UPF0201 family)
MQKVFNVLVLIGLWYCWPQQQLGVIDPQILVAEHAKKLHKSYPNGVPKAKLQQISEQIKATASNYAKQHRMLLLVKNLVWSNEITDHTDNILQMLKEEKP